jgi:hypothetical protein
MNPKNIWRVTLAFLWLTACQGSNPQDRETDRRKASSQEADASKDPRKLKHEIDEVPANLKANLQGYDVFSCIQKSIDPETRKSKIEICFEVSRQNLGNDDTAIQGARAYCAHNEWVAGKQCPTAGVVSVCKGAVLTTGLTYDKYGYDKTNAIDDECAANGGRQVAGLK